MTEQHENDIIEEKDKKDEDRPSILKVAPQSPGGLSFGANSRGLKEMTDDEKRLLEDRNQKLRKVREGQPPLRKADQTDYAGLRRKDEDKFHKKHKQRGVYIEYDLNERLTEEQKLNGKGTVTDIVNKALRMYFAKLDRTRTKDGDGHAD